MSGAPAFFKGLSVTVTGGAGFLGRYVVDKLKERGCTNIFVPRSRDTDLTQISAVKKMYADAKPDIVIHLAAVVGGIGANQSHPGEFFYKNAIMGMQLMEEARLRGIKKFVTVGTICAYPKHTPVPFKEEDLWNGYPEETNAPYGLAKKMLLVQSQAYRAEYGMNAIYLLPVNMYGPGDNFDLETSHVIPAMIRKFSEAKEKNAPEVVLWGTGNVSREFVYVEDVAEAILLATERTNSPDPINIGTGRDIIIKDLAEKINGIIGYQGKLIWDESRPSGQPRRLLNIARAKTLFNFEAKVGFDKGLHETISYFLSKREVPQAS